jgi:tetraacyldisaccharide 4'-kinase
MKPPGGQAGRQTKLQRLRRCVEQTIAGQLPPSLPLKAAAIGYGIAVALRDLLYRRRWLPARHVPCVVLSIGNMVVGGTGKTPMAIHAAALLRRRGYRVALISRGYGGRAGRHGPAVVSNGRQILLGPEAAGDEPLLMAARLPGVPVVVGRDRWQAARLAVARFDTQVIVLDDAYQHRRLARDLDVVLLDYRQPLGNGWLLPAGPLREPLLGLRRAHALVLTRAPDSPAPLPAAVRRLKAGRPVFRARHVVNAALAPPPRRPVMHAMADAPVDGEPPLAGAPVVAFAGIARSQDVFASAVALGYRLVARFAFADHHRYTPHDLARIRDAAGRRGARAVLTTEKDHARLGFHAEFSLPLIVLRVRLDFDSAGAGFDEFLLQQVASRRGISAA